MQERWQNTLMKLTESNYYSVEANKAYFSVSQFKDFMKCPAMAMAELNGTYERDFSKALLLGSYLDESLTGTPRSQQKFLFENEKDIFKKTGGKYAEFVQADETVELVKAQPVMMHYLSGEHQVIMTGEIEGVPFKIKMDSYKPGEYIADLKYMASLRSPNLFEPMIKYWGYDIQAACYQEIVRQNTGERLPFIFVVATKEKPAHLEVGEISQWNMDEALEIVRKNIKRFQAIKNGEIEAERCEDYNCDYCTTTKIIKKPIDTDLFGMSAAQIKSMRGEL
jgi:hypothetical protein